MTNSRQILGQRGEDWVAHQMEQAGYTLCARNWRLASSAELTGELDIVALHGETLVIVEVRTRQGSLAAATEAALASVDTAKQTRLVALAQAYRSAHDCEDRPWRIDVAAVAWNGTRFSLKVITDAVTW